VSSGAYAPGAADYSIKHIFDACCAFRDRKHPNLLNAKMLDISTDFPSFSIDIELALKARLIKTRSP
jgi:hypothetical protein